MGQQSKLRAARRKLAAEQRDRVLGWVAERAPLAEQAAEAILADAEAMALRDRDLPGQRRRLTGAGWKPNPVSEAVVDGLGCWDQCRGHASRLVHSLYRHEDGQVWAHLSLSLSSRLLPSWEQVRDVQWLVYPDLTGVVVVAPPGEHYSIGEVAHVWTCLTARPVPDFRIAGGI
jgi:hypothetical protein